MSDKEKQLALMKQKCALLEKELKIDQLMETVNRLKEDKQTIKERIQKLESGSKEGEDNE